MSIESVLAKCLPETHTDKELEKLLLEDILKNQKRFEKLVKTMFNEYIGQSFCEIIKEKGETWQQARDRLFERDKLHEIKRFITIIKDMYDIR